ncbi:sigma 54-interacting transcriptional regulator [Amorphus sp. 3PC139-8]|uniref:sigma 54-interacting transcriptional regulator n=1 Tax=Amorphus sp. 3PC139-8 TaxID=2735676 RepID=UPI00345DD6B4
MKTTNNRISLADVSRLTGELLNQGNSDNLETGAPPTFSELAECLHFALGDGRIWLNDQRMVLVQSLVLGRIKQEVINALGQERARSLFMRVGYMQGVKDAQLIQKKWPQEDLTHALAAGPRVHTLEGFAKVTTEHFEFDTARGGYYGSFLWHDSSEASEHISCFGLSSEPVCWLQVGYPSGYTTQLFGKPVLFREIECVGMGHSRCKIIGQHMEGWGSDCPEREFLGLDTDAKSYGYVRPVSPKQVAVIPEKPVIHEAMVGVSANFMRTKQLLSNVAPTRATVLFAGETGVGKELFSRSLHDLSTRRDGPFIALNCAAIPEQLVESELFGVEKGAFTGAVSSRPGYFERANGGTLFLDEIASLPHAAQGKLLRILQEMQFERVGGTKTQAVDVRVVAASNVDLRDEVKAGRFREDLYFRLSVFPIDIPPLRERRDDIPLLMAHFLHLYNERHGKSVLGFSRRATDALLKYEYPGNIRELQNLVERGVVYAANDSLIDIAHVFRSSEALPHAFEISVGGRLEPSGDECQSAETEPGINDMVESGLSFEEIERRVYLAALHAAGGNVSEAARSLKMSRPTLDYRLSKLRIK